ncbi:unnamed protein product [Arctogadus glacialis]
MRSSYTCLTKKNLAMEAQRKSKRKRQPTRDLGRVEKAMAELPSDSSQLERSEQHSSQTAAEEAAVVCCSDGSDFESDTVHQPTKRVAAQGSSVAPTAISSLKRSKQENVVWKLKLENAKEKIKSLENERDFLRNQLSEALALANKEDQVTAAPSLHEKSIEKSSSSSSSTSSSSDSSSSSSSSSSERGKKKKKKKKRNNSNNKKDSKKKKGKKGNKNNTKIGKRVLTPEESMDRYRRVFVAVKNGMTKTEAYVKVGVDRKTVAATAAISELHAVDKDLYDQLRASMPKGETLYLFSAKCNLEILGRNLQDKVNEKKSNGELLQIGHRA